MLCCLYCCVCPYSNASPFLTNVPSPLPSSPLSKYFRLNNKCHKCPAYTFAVYIAIPFAIIIIVVTMMFAPLGGALLKVSKAAVAFNFFQFIAITGTLRARWPPFIHDMLSVLTVWNLNIEILRIDCVTEFTFLTRTMVYVAVSCRDGVNELWRSYGGEGC